MLSLLFISLLSALASMLCFAGEPHAADPVQTSDALPGLTWPEPANCSSDSFHKEGKCGGAYHGYLRCPKGYWCSERGFCGTTLAHRTNSSCPRETREDPVVLNFISLESDNIPGAAPDDYDEEFGQYEQYPTEFCSSDHYHRWGKCGFQHHGYFRCPQGEWCSASGYCGKTEKYRHNAICPAETRPDPAIIEYMPTPDDNPDYYGTFGYPDAQNDIVSGLVMGRQEIAGAEPQIYGQQLEAQDDFKNDLPEKDTTEDRDNQKAAGGEGLSADSKPSDDALESAEAQSAELNSRFNVDHGEIPLSQSGGDGVAFRAGNIYWIIALMINLINL